MSTSSGFQISRKDVELQSIGQSQDQQKQLQIRRRPLKQAPKQRLQSLDVYRGLTLYAMTLVDHIAGVKGAFWWLQHVPWHGASFSCLIFPSFLFIMGVAIPFSVKKNRPLELKNIKRICYLFLIGVLVHLVINRFIVSNLRIMGILQRLSVCYGIVLFVHWATEYGTHRLKKILAGVFMLLMVLWYNYKLLTWEDPEQGCFKPNLGRQCNFSKQFDHYVLTDKHMGLPTDPQGTVATVASASLSTYAGYIFGLMIIEFKNQELKFVKFGFGFASTCLLLIYPTSLIIPINKILYTFSFLMLTLTASTTFFTLSFFIIDYLPKKTGKRPKMLTSICRPFFWLGTNSLVIFLTNSVIYTLFSHYILIDGINLSQTLYNLLFAWWIGPHFGSILFSLLFQVGYIMEVRWLYYKKIFIKL